jgi:Tol biopolymer transport system component
MKIKFAVTLIPLLAAFCGEEEESDVLHFDNCDVYPVYNETGAIDPTWSPDMTTVVFSRLGDLWSLPLEGEEPTRITSLSGQELYPYWSPVTGSNQIVFINSDGSGNSTIYTLTPGGGEPQEVVSFSSQVMFTSFSSDGERIVFLQFGKSGIYTVPASGGEVAQIPSSREWVTVEVAEASPARDVVIYVAQANEAYQINEIAIDGGEPRTIVSYSGSVEHPHAVAESYDGTTIAFTTPFQKSYSHNMLFVPSAGGKSFAVTDFFGSSDQPRNPSWGSDGESLLIQLPNGIYMVDLKL